MGVFGLAGIGYTQKLRARVRSDPSLRSKYFEVKKPGGSVVLFKENWAPLKKWVVLFLIGAAIMAAFIVTVVLLK